MFKKFYVVIFITIFCNGVIYSSPTKENIPELIPKEKQFTPVEVTDQPIHKVEPATPVPQTETSPVKTLPNHTEEGKNIPKNSTAFDAKIISQDSGTKNGNTSVTDNKNLNSALSNSNSSTTSTPAGDSHTTSKPAADNHTTTSTLLTDNKPRTDVTSKNNWEMSRPIIAEQSTTPVITPTAGTTTKAPVNKPTVVTPIPAVRTSTSSVHLEHNSPPQSQENGFDGASFVGGIVLTIGLTAIGFIAFKYYKSGKIDGNYRTL